MHQIPRHATIRREFSACPVGFNANWSKVNLIGADLRGADLSGAGLSGVDLKRLEICGNSNSSLLTASRKNHGAAPLTQYRR
jgi:uncharacterized protein YjbI with pentapeptide repeats